MVAGVPEDRVGDRVDRGDRRAARHRRRSSAGSRGRPQRARAPTATSAFAEAISTTDRFPSARRSRSSCRPGTVRLRAQAKGAGMISPAFATMLCFVETDAALDAGDRRPAARRLRQALVRPHLGRRAALDQRHRDPDGVAARAACAIAPESEDELRFGEALDTLLRQLAMLMVRDGEGAARVGRVVVHGGHEPTVGARGARGRRLAAREGRAQRRRPELGPDRAGRRRRAARQRAAAARHLDRGRPGLPRGRGAAVRRGGARRRGGGRRGRVRRRPARRGRRGRGVLLRPRRTTT